MAHFINDFEVTFRSLFRMKKHLSSREDEQYNIEGASNVLRTPKPKANNALTYFKEDDLG